MSQEQYIAIGKIPKALGVDVHSATIHRWRSKGVIVDGLTIKLPAHRIGSRYYVDRGDLVAFLGRLNGTGNPTGVTPPPQPCPKDSEKTLDHYGV